MPYSRDGVRLYIWRFLLPHGYCGGCELAISKIHISPLKSIWRSAGPIVPALPAAYPPPGHECGASRFGAGNVVYLLPWWIVYATMHGILLAQFMTRTKGG